MKDMAISWVIWFKFDLWCSGKYFDEGLLKSIIRHLSSCQCLILVTSFWGNRSYWISLQVGDFMQVEKWLTFVILPWLYMYIHGCRPVYAQNGFLMSKNKDCDYLHQNFWLDVLLQDTLYCWTSGGESAVQVIAWPRFVRGSWIIDEW